MQCFNSLSGILSIWLNTIARCLQIETYLDKSLGMFRLDPFLQLKKYCILIGFCLRQAILIVHQSVHNIGISVFVVLKSLTLSKGNKHFLQRLPRI